MTTHDFSNLTTLGTEHLEDRLHGHDYEFILDLAELATEGRQFTNYEGAKQSYLIATIASEQWGIGFRVEQSYLIVTTLLTPDMLITNERKRTALNMTSYLVA